MTDHDNWRSLPRNAFGDTPALADELLGLILAGRKRATCWSAEEGRKGTVVGALWVVEDGKGEPRAVVRTTALECKRFDEVDADFAIAEGEGDLSLEYWRKVHRLYFERNGGFTPEMKLWCEHFELVETLTDGA